MKKIFKLILLWIVLLAVDLFTKHAFYGLNCCADWSFVTKVFNTGISRGINLPSVMTLLITAFAIGLFIWMYIKKQFTRWMLALLMAGTLGNLIDRLLFGGVRDFISIGSFPVFNIADVLLNLWIILFIIWELKLAKRR